MEKDKKLFWLSHFNGVAKGGYFLRTDLFKHHITKLKNNGVKVVGIILEDSFNAELLIEAEPNDYPEYKKTRYGYLKLNNLEEKQWEQEA